MMGSSTNSMLYFFVMIIMLYLIIGGCYVLMTKIKKEDIKDRDGKRCDS